MKVWLTALALALLASPCWGQIVVPSQVDEGRPIVATVSVADAEGRASKVSWEHGEAVSHIASKDGKIAHVWAKRGQHRLVAVVTTDIFRTMTVFVPDPEHPDDPTKAKRETLTILQDRESDRHEATFTVGEGPAPEPKPDPTPEPKPDPKPGPLGVLVPPAARPHLVEFYADWARVIRGGAVGTTGEFRAAYRESAKALQHALNATGWATIDPPINQRLTAAIGLEDSAIDAAKREALAKALDSISADFKGG